LDLGQHKPDIVAEKRIDLPHVSLKRNKRTALFDDGAAAQRQHGFGLENRNIVFELEALQIGAARLDRQRRGSVVADANANRGLVTICQISLADEALAGDRLPPGVVDNQEFALDLE